MEALREHFNEEEISLSGTEAGLHLVMKLNTADPIADLARIIHETV